MSTARIIDLVALTLMLFIAAMAVGTWYELSIVCFLYWIGNILADIGEELRDGRTSNKV